MKIKFNLDWSNKSFYDYLKNPRFWLVCIISILGTEFLLSIVTLLSGYTSRWFRIVVGIPFLLILYYKLHNVILFKIKPPIEIKNEN